LVDVFLAAVLGSDFFSALGASFFSAEGLRPRCPTVLSPFTRAIK